MLTTCRAAPETMLLTTHKMSYSSTPVLPMADCLACEWVGRRGRKGEGGEKGRRGREGGRGEERERGRKEKEREKGRCGEKWIKEGWRGR